MRRVSASRSLTKDLFDAVQAETHKRSSSGSLPVIDAEKGRSVFVSEEFARIMAKYKNFSFHYRLHNGIIQHAQQNGSDYVFNLYWADSESYYRALRITLTRHAAFARKLSRFITKENFSKLIPDAETRDFSAELCWSLKIELVTSPYNDIPDHEILNLWFSQDGKIGEIKTVSPFNGLPENELRRLYGKKELKRFHGGKFIYEDLVKRSRFSGNEVLRVYQYFAEFLNIENIFLFDDDVLKRDGHYPVPLRLVYAIAGDQTLYEKTIPGLRLFETKSFHVSEFNFIQQNSEARRKVLTELQALPLSKWHEMLGLDEQKFLKKLYLKYFPPARQTMSGRLFKNADSAKSDMTSFENITLQMLVRAVYAQSRQDEIHMQDLLKLCDVLCGNIRVEFGQALQSGVVKSRDHWVKSRVYKLLWESLIWVQQPAREEDKKHTIQTGTLML